MNPYPFRTRSFPARGVPDGVIRMDRAALYLRSQLAELISIFEAKTTKTVGESVYLIYRFSDQMGSLCSMAGESSLLHLARELRAIVDRSPRTAAIQQLSSLMTILESFEAERRIEEEEALLEQRRLIEDRIEGAEDIKTKVSVSDPRAVFVIMPFRQEFNDVWKGGIQRACEELGLTAIRVDMINRSSNITDDIVQSIEACRIAISDVTENNPNVMFELGYTIAKSKPNIIISQSSDYLPFDIRHLRTIVYANTWSGIEELRQKLIAFLNESLPKETPASKPVASKNANRRPGTK